MALNFPGIKLISTGLVGFWSRVNTSTAEVFNLW